MQPVPGNRGVRPYTHYSIAATVASRQHMLKNLFSPFGMLAERAILYFTSSLSLQLVYLRRF